MVVMPEYLMTTSKQNPTKPRIISEVKKNCFSKLKLTFTTSLQDFGKPKYSGELLWNIGSSDWVLRTAEVRQGSLILINKETSTVVLRQPLRELNLRACSTPRTFSLAEAEGVGLLMFQALSEEEYERWVRILAAELIRQTPLQNVRFLDILSIIKNKELDKNSLKKGKSEECIVKATGSWGAQKNSSHQSLGHYVNQPHIKENNQRSTFQKREDEENDEKHAKVKVKYQKSAPVVAAKDKRYKLWPRTQSMNSLVSVTQKGAKLTSDESGISSGEENQSDAMIRDMENFSFLSVKERKKFFESLSSEIAVKVREKSPLMRSNSISNFKQAANFIPERYKLSKRKRTKSLHDLHKTPVKEICQLFESQERHVERTSYSETCDRVTQKRLLRQERKLEKLTNQIAEVEETILTVSDDIKSIEFNTLERKEGLEVFAGLQKRLNEEHSKLGRLKDEMTTVIEGRHKTNLKMEKYNEKRY